MPEEFPTEKIEKTICELWHMYPSKKICRLVKKIHGVTISMSFLNKVKSKYKLERKYPPILRAKLFNSDSPNYQNDRSYDLQKVYEIGISILNCYQQKMKKKGLPHDLRKIKKDTYFFVTAAEIFESPQKAGFYFPHFKRKGIAEKWNHPGSSRNYWKFNLWKLKEYLNEIKKNA